MSASAIYFKNTSSEDFIATWDSVPYSVKAGQQILLQSYIARHLAKRLAMRELGKQNQAMPINPHQDDNGNFTNTIFAAEVEKYLSADEDVIEEETPEKLEIAMIIEKKKKGRPAKNKQEVKEEEEFPELKK